MLRDMSDPSDTPTEPVEAVDEADEPAAPTGEDPVRTVTRKGAALAMAACLVGGGLLGWVAATALDDDEAQFDPITAFEERMQQGGRGRFPGGGPQGPHAGGMGGFPGGGRDDWGGPGDGWHEWEDGERPTPPWEQDGDGDDGDDQDDDTERDAPDTTES